MTIRSLFGSATRHSMDSSRQRFPCCQSIDSSDAVVVAHMIVAGSGETVAADAAAVAGDDDRHR